MNKNDLFRAFDDVDDDILERSEITAPLKKAPSFRKWGVLAACLALVISLAGIAFVAEAREYGAAVEFFEENGLSMEGLSRSDVKEVYRDITTEHFTYDKTAQVISQSVPGVEISEEHLTPEELAEAWEKNSGTSEQEETEQGISYHWDTYESTKSDGSDIEFKWGLPTRSYMVCHRDGEFLWRVNFSYFLPHDPMFTSVGTLVWGRDDGEHDDMDDCATLMLIDDSGNIKWQRWINHGFEGGEHISAVIDNGDGTFAVLGSGYEYADDCWRYDRYDYENRLVSYLCLSQYDKDGNELSFRKTGETEIRSSGNVGVCNAVRFGENYFVQVRDTAEFVKLDREGNLLDSFTYGDEKIEYNVRDMVEFAGQLYICVDAKPKENEAEYDSRTAMLLLCDPEGGELKTFYSVKDLVGQELTVNDAGELVWKVMDISMFKKDNPESGFSDRFMSCREINYSFDTDGNLIGQKTTLNTYRMEPTMMNSRNYDE